jgi:hypothetical protein
MGSAQTARPPVVRFSDRAQAELRAGEALVFDWTGLAFCCAVAGEVSLRPTTLQQAQHSSVYLPLWSGDGPVVFAHRRAYPMLVGRDIEVDCRRRLGVRSFSSSLPPDLGLRTSARVNLSEADPWWNHCVVAGSSFGWLIHTIVGSAGGSGSLRTKRSGCSA